MAFKCSKNKFLEKILNMKPIPLQTYQYQRNGQIVALTNHKILQDFLSQASSRELIQVQQMLAIEKYSIQAINKFLQSAGQEIVNKM